MQAFATNPDVAFGDVNLAEDQVRETPVGGNHNPGEGGWPTQAVRTATGPTHGPTPCPGGHTEPASPEAGAAESRPRSALGRTVAALRTRAGLTDLTDQLGPGGR